MKNFNEFDEYQTFNEFELKGVNSPKIQSPFILLKKESDTIFVVKSNKKDEIIEYVNKGKYWYRSFKIEKKQTIEERFLGRLYKIDRTPIGCEKFIFNDTIVEYTYFIEEFNKKSNSTVYVKTKDSVLELTIQDDDIKNTDNPYLEIINLVHNYRVIFPHYSADYQKRWYRIFLKQIIGNTLYLYEINGGEKKMQHSIKLNSMREFDLPPGIK